MILPITPEHSILYALFLPLISFFGILLADRAPNLRETVILGFAAVTFLFVLNVAGAVGQGARPTVTLFEILPGLSLSFQAEPLGAMFAVIASGLYIVNSLYSIGYMRGNGEAHQTRFYGCFAIAIAAAIGIAFAGNLLTFFTFYEILTLSTFPLVTHKENQAAKRGGAIYLGILIGTSIGLLLPAIIWTWVLTGTTDFVPGGVLAGSPDFRGLLPAVLLGLYLFGIGKAALMPVHPWLPNAMVAPTPVSAFLHAVAVVKAGVFGVLKIALYVFGMDVLREADLTDIFIVIAAFSILAASAIAMTQDNLKARLAYSTVSQLSYVTLGALLATQYGVLGGASQIAAHALGKMTLFMCAGAIYTAAHLSLISDMRGTGRAMPLTWTMYIVGACSIIGLPPLAGTWPKFLLMVGAMDAGHQLVFAVLILSSLMNIVYLLTPAIRAFTDPPPPGMKPGVREAPIFCLIPLTLTGVGTIVLFFAMDGLLDYLAPLVGGGGQ
ncbi:putative NADH-ubiquinone oxidoreductase subunit [Parvularcula bermudensis HTCC2503]|uniref:Putative NADH-ubiquinone oxidoreductase subunit n=1 Tax=Parvularcula bermudensis (strain ATCC BAA-594 / HTCC2503 / KCTC 12087) TaxID=314260 RepID=E0TD59_PARBH|nr:proton-conducting transporter membrane subunit [Parvularcula bermudensis]ADM08718.1 putative NADH-ubiquinone oxidoreductase subunit [Parvularcula bermudensis HTCC2503]